MCSIELANAITSIELVSAFASGPTTSRELWRPTEVHEANNRKSINLFLFLMATFIETSNFVMTSSDCQTILPGWNIQPMETLNFEATLNQQKVFWLIIQFENVKAYNFWFMNFGIKVSFLSFGFRFSPKVQTKTKNVLASLMNCWAFMATAANIKGHLQMLLNKPINFQPSGLKNPFYDPGSNGILRISQFIQAKGYWQRALTLLLPHQ